jgi:hypothetical protein
MVHRAGPPVSDPVSDCRHQTVGFKLQALGFRLQASGFRLQVSGFRFRAAILGL